MGKQARTKSRELRKAQAAMAAQRGRRRPLVVGGVVVILGLVIAIVVAVVNAANRDTGGSTGALVTPKGATAAGALVIGPAAAPVKLEVYLDYMCPYCGRFDRANADEVARMVAAGTARLEIYPLSFLDKMSNGTRY
ncbi:MAG TPA: thioredoxin domain-containing protein, partial [Actinoplanes sp.]|nr:thioredoxin domain-containing protein [Actinoplanes sp.]